MKFASRLSLSFLCVGALIAGSGLAASKNWKVADSQVSFQAVGKPGFIRINGKNAKVNGASSWDGTQLKGEYRVQLSELETGLSLRDEHMRDKYLEVKKYPEAVLVLEPLNWDAASEANLPFKGKLTLHGVEQSIEGQAKLSPKAQGFAVEASFQLILSQFKIDIPVYAGVTVAEKVDVKISMESN